MYEVPAAPKRAAQGPFVVHVALNYLGAARLSHEDVAVLNRAGQAAKIVPCLLKRPRNGAADRP